MIKLLACSLLLFSFCSAGPDHQSVSNAQKSVQKNGMQVHWHFDEDNIWFEVSAPTQGWVTIGFNTQDALPGTYLLMARVRNGEAEVVPHYTLAPGDYRPFPELGPVSQARNVSGTEKANSSRIAFSLPREAMSQYEYAFAPEMGYFLLLAYSASDDFQHHSRMRTSLSVLL